MSGVITKLAQKRQEIEPSQPLPFTLLHADEAITLILYEPHAEDTQEPHDQDECYFVASGRASIRIAGELFDVETDDAILVPALTEHRFEQPSDNFTCWALFYGPRKTGDNDDA